MVEVSFAGEHVGEKPTAQDLPIRLLPRGRQDAFASLDHLKNVFSPRAHVLKTIPSILKGAFRCALKTALDEVIAGKELGSESRMTRGWKLFMLFPRLLLPRLLWHQPSGDPEKSWRNGSFGSKKACRRGCCKRAKTAKQVPTKHHPGESAIQVDSLERASKSFSLVQLGGLPVEGVIGRSRGGTGNNDNVANSKTGAEPRDCTK